MFKCHNPIFSFISESGCFEPINVTNSFRILNGSIQNETERFIEGSKVSYKCIQGYERQSGNMLRECIKDATKYFWSGSSPVCERNMLFIFNKYLLK